MTDVDLNCDEPATIERDMAELVQEAVQDILWLALISPFLIWLVGGVVLFGAGRLAAGDPSFTGTLALSGWAALPEFFRLGVGLLGLRIALADVTITDLNQADAVLESALAPISPILVLASLATVGWQWYLLTVGMVQEADISTEAAAFSTGVPLGLLTLFSMV